jgi:hypothetical protein
MASFSDKRSRTTVFLYLAYDDVVNDVVCRRLARRISKAWSVEPDSREFARGLDSFARGEDPMTP